MNKNIALDGPKNGLYIDAKTAAENDYTDLILWNQDSGEEGWLHITSTDDIPAEFVNDQENYS